MTPAEALAILHDLRRLAPEQRRHVFKSLPVPAQRAILDEWWWQAHGGQAEPGAAANGEAWRVWAIVAGRGFGKTRAGAEWVWAQVRAHEKGTRTCSRKSTCPLSSLRIALVAASLDEVARVMVEGESGLLAVARADESPRWISSRGLLLFPSGAEAHAFTAEKPDKLRGPQHHFAWCDELAKWPRADDTWDNLMLGLRLGTHPRAVVTTTPKPVPLLHRILAMRRCAATHGRTADNPNLAADFIAAMADQYAGTRLARQELDGELLEDHENALWTRALIEKSRGVGVWGSGIGEAHPPTPKTQSPTPTRIVIGLDPPASTGGDSCGIVVCGKDEAGIAWVLADLSAGGLSPEAWARRVAEAAEHWGQLYTGVPAKVVAEKNQGGDMIASILRAVDADLPLRLVAATKSKAARAEPIALRFETGRARLAGRFPELEDQMCAITWQGYQGQGSPDRLDAMVWAMTDLFAKQRPAPRVRAL